jgi:hypothetical protein
VRRGIGVELLALLVAQLNEAGAAGGRGKNCSIDDADPVLPTLASIMCVVRRGIGVSSESRVS